MRIVTYNDPRKIEEIKEWDELCKYPHLAISDTLVQGLSYKCGREKFKFITTIDNFFKYLYKDWKNNSELEIKQYFELTKELDSISESDELKSVFKKNKNEILKSIRLLIEANVAVDEIDDDNTSMEFSKFKEIYKSLITKENWSQFDYLDDIDEDSIKVTISNILIEQVKDELKYNFGLNNVIDNITMMDDLKKYFNKINEHEDMATDSNLSFNRFDKRQKKYKQIQSKKVVQNNILFFDNLTDYKLEKIVIHGVHQFTPLMCRFIKLLQKINVDIIFLIQYNDELKILYKTWNEVYKWTTAKFEINKDTISTIANKKVGQNYANLISGNFDKLGDNDCEFLVFDNITEFSNHVAEIYDSASRNIDKSVPNRKGKILANMDEQFYSVDGKNVNSLLSTYFPEQFGENHFLAYPIGQFILGLYNMWDYEKNKMIIKEESLKECLAVNLWKNYSDDFVPLDIFEKIKVYFTNTEDVDIYLEYIDKLIRYNDALNRKGNEKFKKEYSLLSFFTVSVGELQFFKLIIMDLKKIQEKLFINETVKVRQHYKELITILSEKTDSENLTETENLLLEELSDKLSFNDDDISSSIKELGETIYFYLKVKQQDDNSNWIVRDFQQIDGAIFLADDNVKSPDILRKKSVYHYVEISDKNINDSKKIDLPWPLKEKYFIRKNEIIDIYMVSRKEYANFLKCTLFYGMYYLNRDLKISYIKNVDGDNSESLYFPLKMLNIDPTPYTSEKELDVNRKKEERESVELVNKFSLSKMQVMNISFCPRRFYYEGLFDKVGSYSDVFLSKLYTKTLLSILSLDEYNAQGKKISLEAIIDKRIKKGEESIPAFKNDFQDFKASIISYCNKNINSKKDQEYDEIKKNYINRLFTEDDKKLLVSKCCNKNENIKNYNRIKYYLKYDRSWNKPLETQCLYCKYKEICIFDKKDNLGE